MSTEILCTLGPSSMNPSTLKRLEALGVDLYRINLSHTAVQDVADVINYIRKHSNIPICLDSEGAQIRTGYIKGGKTTVEENTIVEITSHSIAGNSQRFNLTPLGIISEFQVGDFISIDFNSVFAQVIEKNQDSLKVKIMNSGEIGKNKAVTLERDIELESITEKDRKAFEIGVKMGIKNFALSFAHNKENVQDVRKIVGKDAKIISKIECHDALMNLEDIINESDSILIDRGDLSREEPLERIPFLQKKIIETGKKLNTKVYVATNLLESMITEQLPTRAEVNDIYNTLNDGADGLVLAAETAIGKYPTKAVGMVKKIIHEYERAKIDTSLPDRSMNTLSLLIPPHGGRLIDQKVSKEQLAKLDKYKKIQIPDVCLMDAEQIAIGTYSPLEGFMNSEMLNSVLEDYKTPDGVVWTLPIVLQVEDKIAETIAKGETIALCNSDNEVHALLEVDDLYTPDLKATAVKWFGTESTEHPGVARVLAAGNWFVGGKVSLVKKSESQWSEFTFTPKQSRYLFERKGWSRVVGFHSRNVVHRVHEFIQKEALTRTHADGLYITPVIGPKKKGDFQTDAILSSYKVMVDYDYYPKGQVILGAFNTYSRYSGPREAVFTALCRKNMGCSHFIIGRDHTGVGSFYDADANPDLFKKLGDIGVKPVFFEAIGYNEDQKQYGPLEEGSKTVHISGTEVRDSLSKEQKLPDWFMREEIQDMLITQIKSGASVFF